MIFLDTGFLLALVQPRDALHGRAVAWSAAVAEPLLTTDYILWETVNAFSALADRAKAHRLLRHLATAAGYTIVPASAALTAEGLRMHEERDDKSWSLTDCISFVVMAERGVVRALSHDHHFEQAGFEALLRRDPP